MSTVKTLSVDDIGRATAMLWMGYKVKSMDKKLEDAIAAAANLMDAAAFSDYINQACPADDASAFWDHAKRSCEVWEAIGNQEIAPETLALMVAERTARGDLHEMIKEEEEMSEEMSEEISADKSVSGLIKGDLATANMLFRSLSGDVLSLEMLDEMAANSAKAKELSQQCADLNRKLLSRPLVAAPAKFTSEEVGDLNGEVEWRKAWQVFELTGQAKKVMTFDVPVWTWRNDDGEAANNPEVPVVDAFYKFDARLFECLRAIINREHLWVWGHTGAGKTSLIEQVAARLGFPMPSVSMDGEITRMDLIGQTKLSQSGGVTVTSFAEGVLPRAMQRPSILLLDEMDFIRGDVAYALQTVLNSKEGTLNLLEDGGRVVARHPWSIIVATANTNGRGDESGRYNYAKRQSSALLNRFTSWMKVDYLSQSDERKLLMRVIPEIDDTLADSLVDYAKLHRSAFLKDEIEMALSLRNLIALGNKALDYSQFFDKEKALSLAFENTVMNAACEEDAIAINGIKQRILGMS
jgi:cobaltochelatase CobS